MAFRWRSSHVWRMSAAATLSTTSRLAGAFRPDAIRAAIGNDGAEALVTDFHRYRKGSLQLRHFPLHLLRRRAYPSGQG